MLLYSSAMWSSHFRNAYHLVAAGCGGRGKLQDLAWRYREIITARSICGNKDARRKSAGANCRARVVNANPAIDLGNHADLQRSQQECRAGYCPGSGPLENLAT